MKGKTFFKGAAAVLLAVLAFSGLCSAEKREDLESIAISSRVMCSPLMVLGTYDEQGRPNFALFDRGGVVTTKPQPHIAVAIRRYSYTHGNVLFRRAVTINLPSEDLIEATDLFGSFTGFKDGVYRNKLEATDLSARKGSVVNAPLLPDFPISMECELAADESVVPGAPFTLFIFKVVKVWVDPDYLNSEGSVNPLPANKPGLALYVPGRSDGNAGYYTLGKFLGPVGEAGKPFRKKLAEDDAQQLASPDVPAKN